MGSGTSNGGSTTPNIDSGTLDNWWSGVIPGLSQSISNAVESGLSGLSSIFNSIADAIRETFTAVGNAINGLIVAIGDGFKSLPGMLSTALNSLMSHIQTFFDPVIDFAQNTWAFISKYLNPFSDDFYLKLAFIPSENFDQWVKDEHAYIKSKFAIVDTVGASISAFQASLHSSSTAPKIEITLPDTWGGDTIEVINFALIAPYISILKQWISLTIITYTVFKVYKMLPDVIYT